MSASGADVPRQPTAEMPLMAGRRLQLFQALEDHGSLYRLSGMLGTDLVEDYADIEKEHGMRARDVSEWLGHDYKRGWTMFFLLHSISVQILRSIILGTVAYDYHRPRPSGEASLRSQGYSEDGADVYVIAIHIPGRDGKLLNVAELDTLRQCIDEYAEAAQMMETTDPSDRDPEQRRQAIFVHDVDTAIGQWAFPTSRWMPASGHNECVSEERAREIRALSDGFRLRYDRSLALDPVDRDAHQVQSPLYVGCANKLRERLESYDEKSTLALINKPLGLTLCILQLMGLSPQTVHLPVLCVWEEDQLRPAEVLVTALARSLVFQDGFNVDQPGRQDMDKECASIAVVFGCEMVLGQRPFLRDNLRLTEAEISERLDCLERARKLSAQVDSLRAKSEAAKLALEAAAYKLTELEAAQVSRAATLQLKAEAVQVLRRRIESTAGFLATCEALYGDGSDDEGSENDGADEASGN